MTTVRHAFRALRAAPAFTGVALLVLTLGIGASTAIFSVVDAVVLRDLPLDRSDQLMVVGQIRADVNRNLAIAPQDFADWQTQQDVFDGLAAWMWAGAMTIQGNQPESLRAVRATANLWSVLHASPRRGALFSASNERAGADHVAVLSDAFWRRRFGADPAAVGQTMNVDGETWSILGVMPPGFGFPLDQRVDMWIPFVVPAAEHVRGATFRTTSSLQVIGRLKPGVSPAHARSRMHAINADLATRFPDWFRNRTTSVRLLRETIIAPGVRSWMLMLLAAVTFVLLIACVNVASLMLARATARSRELGVRAALGASRWQLVRGVLAESLLLSGMGTMGGVVGAYGFLEVIRVALPANMPRSANIAVNGRVLFAAAAASVLTGVACGILPALQGSRPDLTRALREGSRSASATRGRQRLRAILVGAEVGLAIVLLVGAGLFLSSFIRLTSIDLGLNYQHVLTVGLSPKASAPTREARAAAAARVPPIVSAALPIVQSLPGVEYAAALSGTRPFEGGNDRANVTVHGREQDFQGLDDAADLYFVTPDYPLALGVPLVRGRIFRADENNESAPVVLLNEFAAARFFPGVDPIGQTIGLMGDRTIVGILHNVRAGGPETEMRPEAYLPFAHDENPNAYLVVRTKGDPAAAMPAVKGAVRQVAPDLPLSDVRTLEDFFGRLVAPRRFNMLIIGVFGVLALAIASAGIYGVMAYVVEQRTSEIGLRMALGALPGEVVSMILGRALAIILAGLAAGLLIAWPLAQTLSAFLFQVRPHNLAVYALASFVLLLVGLIAAAAPARRAARVDPLVALRSE